LNIAEQAEGWMDTKKMAFDMKEKLVEMRRQLHTIPEVAFEEKKTAAFIAKTLKQLGIEVKTGIAKTGVVGILKGKGKRTVALRADMDALPVTEALDVPYRSKHEGRMHACGHDAHMSMLLGAAEILSKNRDALNGAVKFIFQPSEESLPGGAKQMIAEGVLKGVDAIFGLHVDPTIPTGKVGYMAGALMAFTSEFTIVLEGKGGHAAAPEMSVDPIVMASVVIQELQKIPSRWISPKDPVIVTIGAIHGGTTYNIIPDRVEMKGTVRLLRKELVDKVVGKIEKVLQSITGLYGGAYQLQFNKGYPVLVNEKRSTAFAATVIRNLFGDKQALGLDTPLMGGEDFSYYLEQVPGTFLRLGTANKKKGTCFPWHHPAFNVDEDALPYGTALLAQMAMEFLQSQDD
jgi:amidohydrolase